MIGKLYLICTYIKYRDIRHDERPRLRRGHSSCRMSQPSLCILVPLSSLFSVSRRPPTRPHHGAGSQPSLAAVYACERMQPCMAVTWVAFNVAFHMHGCGPWGHTHALLPNAYCHQIDRDNILSSVFREEFLWVFYSSH